MIRSAWEICQRFYLKIIQYCTLLSPFLDLGIRLYIAQVFFKSGLTKIDDFSTTLSLFENEYHVPILTPKIAAYLGTSIELTFPVLLLVGFLSRPAALLLFIFNAIAATSYPDLSEAGVRDHMLWGGLLLVTLFHGPGKLSLDHLIWRKS